MGSVCSSLLTAFVQRVSCSKMNTQLWKQIMKVEKSELIDRSETKLYMPLNRKLRKNVSCVNIILLN